MISISLCMITKNAEKTLKVCLESIKDYVEEIIIVDTGSEDNTLAIAKAYTQNIYEIEWEDDFSKARNFSFSKASKEYILWLDADDFVPESEQSKIGEMKQSLDPRVDVVMMNYHMVHDPKGNLMLSGYRERMVKRQHQMRWSEPVHEVIKIEGYIYFLDIFIVHTGESAKHSLRNLSIYEKYLSKGNQLSSRGKLYYASELFEIGQYEQAKQRFEAFLEEEEADAQGCVHACLMIHECNHYLGKKGIDILYRSFKYRPVKKEICSQIGHCFLEEKAYKQAVFWYELALGLPKEPYDIGATYHEQETYLPHLGLYECYMKIGQREKAMLHQKEVAQLRPKNQ